MTVRPSTSDKQRAQSGFALVISLSLMAFILLLLLSLTSLIHVESSTSETQSQTMLARQNALLGLQIALGNLQKKAGADVIATGTVDADSSLNADSSKQYWTATWQNQGSYDSQRNLVRYQPQLTGVLVSGENTAAALDAPTIETWPILVGDDTVSDPEQKVQAPPVDIDSGQSLQSGRYAFWVGDEGVKARVNLTDTLDDDLDDYRRLLVIPRTGSEMMRATTDPDDGLLGDAFPSDPASLEQMFTNPSIDLSVTGGERFRKANFHDLTLHSKGVLSDQRLGGLRHDLSWMLANDALPTGYLYEEPVTLLSRSFVPGPAWSLLKDFYQRSIQLSQTGQLTPQPSIREIGVPDNQQNSISPVLTQLKLYFNFSFSDPTPGTDGGHLRMHLFPLVVLHNPYNAPLAETDYIFHFEQHNTQDSTELKVQVDTSDGDSIEFGGYKFKDGLNALFDPKAKSGSNDRSGSIFFHADDLSFAPGEIKILTLQQTDNYLGPINPTLATFNNNDPKGNLLVEGFDDSKSAIIEFSDTLADGKEPTFYEFELVNSGILRFRLHLQGDQYERFLSKYDGVAYSASSPISAAAEQGNNLVMFPKAGFSYKIDTTNLRYLVDFNPRGTNVSLNGYEPMGQTLPPRLYQGDFGLGDFTTDFDPGSGSGFFGSGHSSSDQNRVTFFEIPRNPEELLSLGQLRHIDLSMKTQNPGGTNYDYSNIVAPAYILGNSEGNPSIPRTLTYYDDSTSQWFALKAYFDDSYRTNEALWDAYYFSSMFGNTQPDSTYEQPKNPRLSLEIEPDSVGSDALSAARHLMIQGAFNVNSTSTEAWKAVLSGLDTQNLRRLDDSIQSNQSKLFPRSIHPLGSAFTASSAGGPTNSNVWDGVRSLTEDEISDLATAIVAQIRERGPFLSLADFINRDLIPAGDPDADQAFSGAIQTAIETADLNSALNGPQITTPPTGTNYPEPEFFNGHAYDSAPGAINQADIITPIASFIAARSDTFRIRAYGEVGDSIAGQAPAKAWVEAIVQRYPEKTDTTEPIETAALEPTFGRKFQIVSIRWLPPQN